MEALQTALALDDNDSDVHRILAAINVIQDKHDQAVYHQRRALSLNPNDDLVVVQQGEILTWLGQPEEGIDWIKKAMRLNPYHPERFWSHLARACFAARRYGEAIDALKCISGPDALVRAGLAACHAQLGAAAAAEEERLATLAAGAVVHDRRVPGDAALPRPSLSRAPSREPRARGLSGLSPSTALAPLAGAAAATIGDRPARALRGPFLFRTPVQDIPWPSTSTP